MQTAPLPAISTGPNPQDFQYVEREVIDKMPLAQYYRDVRGNIVNAQSAFYYDSTYIKVGVAVPAVAKKSLFTLGKQNADTQFGTATTTGEKTEFMTNMINDGEFEGGTTFIMEGAGVQCIASADLPTTVAANGAITAPNYTASVVISAPNNLLAVLNNLELRFVRGEDIRKRGPLVFWPAPPGVGLAGASGSPNGGFFQNGQNGLVQFTHPIMLQSEDKFSFDLVNVSQNAFTPTIDMLLRVVIWGTVIKTHQPY